MQAHELTAWHRSELEATVARARAAREADAARAHELGADAEVGGEPDLEMKLWLTGGYWAGIFCLWFAFVAPIVLIVTHWD